MPIDFNINQAKYERLSKMAYKSIQKKSFYNQFDQNEVNIIKDLIIAKDKEIIKIFYGFMVLKDNIFRLIQLNEKMEDFNAGSERYNEFQDLLVLAQDDYSKNINTIFSLSRNDKLKNKLLNFWFDEFVKLNQEKSNITGNENRVLVCERAVELLISIAVNYDAQAVRLKPKGL